MKSVMNANSRPFHAYRYGHEEGLRSSSLMARVATRAGAASAEGSSVCRMPAGQRTRTASAALPEAARAQRHFRAHSITVADQPGESNGERVACRPAALKDANRAGRETL